ncbi:MAG: BatD family protein [Polyangiaceae bacterium]|nr:BatD family protein [Polyangiaceae bacterium]
MNRWWCWLLLVALATWVRPVRAQIGADVTLVANTRVAEIGEPFSVTLTVLAEVGGAAVSAPSLLAPAGVTLRGPSVSTREEASIINGQITQSVGISATWLATATLPGRVTFGPATARVGSTVVRSRSIVVEVVPKGQGNRGRQRRRVDPFGFLDPFSSGFPALPGLGAPFDARPEPAVEEESSSVPDQFRVERAPDPHAFLRAVVEPRRVVLGEQVTLSTLIYHRRARVLDGSFKPPQHPDFISHLLVETSKDQDEYRVRIGEDIWRVSRIWGAALFPVRTGRLAISPATIGVLVPGSRRAGERSTKPIEIVVEEPPTAGRPPGYALGDVGRFTLDAKVEPRSVTAGGAISVVLTVRGTGNFPMKVRLPQQSGVEWLPPTTSDGITMSDGHPSGWRRLSHVVRLGRPGRIDLGEAVLPFWDPARHGYSVARARLGEVEVTGSVSTSTESTGRDVLAGLIAPRRTLGAAATPRVDWGDRTGFWAFLLGAPVVVWLLGAAVRGLGEIKQRWTRREPSARTMALRDLTAARRAVANDPATVAGACERALLRAISEVAGFPARGVLRAELGQRLVAAGLDGDLADRVAALLGGLDEVRFTGVSGGDAADLVERADAIVRALFTLRPRGREGAS